MNTPNHPVLRGPELEDSAFDFDVFWQRNKSLILGGALALVVGGAALLGWFVYSASTKAAAQNLLAVADNIAGLEAVIQKYPHSLPAADALMRLAASQREAGDTEKSTATFREFLSRFPEHPLAGGALLGVAQNQDASGDIEGAMATCQQVVTQYPQSYAAPFAAYNEAEILLRIFRRDEARRNFNMVVSQFPQSPAARMAAAQLHRIGTPPTDSTIQQP
jgi:TolA-binding protein